MLQQWYDTLPLLDFQQVVHDVLKCPGDAVQGGFTHQKQRSKGVLLFVEWVEEVVGRGQEFGAAEDVDEVFGPDFFWLKWFESFPALVFGSLEVTVGRQIHAMVQSVEGILKFHKIHLKC